MRKLIINIIVEFIFFGEKVKSLFGIAEWEIYNAKYYKSSKLRRKVSYEF